MNSSFSQNHLTANTQSNISYLSQSQLDCSPPIKQASHSFSLLDYSKEVPNQVVHLNKVNCHHPEPKKNETSQFSTAYMTYQGTQPVVHAPGSFNSSLLVGGQQRGSQQLQMNLSSRFAEVIQRIQEDEFIKTMSNDTTSKEYIRERIAEICNDVLGQCQMELANNEHTAQMMMHERQNSNSMSCNSHGRSTPLKDLTNKSLRDVREQSRNQASFYLEKAKDSVYSEQAQELQEYKQLVLQLQSQLQFLQQSKSSSQSDTLQMLKEYGDQLTKQFSEQNQKQLDKFRKKNEQLKQKVKEQKEAIHQMSSERVMLERNTQQQLDQVNGLQEELTSSRQGVQLRIVELENHYQQRISDLQFQHQQQVNVLQRDYQRMVEEKMAELLNKHSFELQKHKQDGDTMRATIQDKVKQIERDYIKISDHESIVNKEVKELQQKHKETLKSLKTKLEKEIRSQVEGEYQFKLKDTERNASEYKREFEQANESIFELKKSLKEKQSSLEEAEWKFERLSKQNQKVVEESETYREELEKAKYEISEIGEYGQRMQAELNSRIQQLEEELDLKENEGMALNLKVREVEEQNCKMSEILREVTNSSNALTQEIENLKEKLFQMDEEMEGARQVMEEQREKIQEYQVWREKAELREQELVEELEIAQNENKYQDKRLGKLNYQLESLYQHQIKNLKQNYSKLQKQARDFQHTFKSDLSTALSQVQSLSHHIHSQQKQESLLRSRCDQLEETYASQFEEFLQKLNCIKQEKEDLQGQFQTLKSQNQKLAAEKQKAEEQYEVTRQRLDQLMGGYTQLRTVYESKAEKIKHKSADLLKDRIKVIATSYEEKLLEIKKNVENLKAKYGRMLMNVQDQLEQVYSQFGMEYSDQTSRYESQYESLKMNLDQEQFKMKETKKQLIQLAREKESEADLHEQWKQERSEELQSIHGQVRSLVKKLDDQQRENKELKQLEASKLSKEKKKQARLLETIGEREREIDELNRMLQSSISLAHQHQSMLIETDRKPLAKQTPTFKEQHVRKSSLKNGKSPFKDRSNEKEEVAVEQFGRVQQKSGEKKKRQRSGERSSSKKKLQGRKTSKENSREESCYSKMKYKLNRDVDLDYSPSSMYSRMNY